MAKRRPPLAEAMADWLNDGSLYTPTLVGVFKGTVRRSPGLPKRILRRCDRCDAEPTWANVSPAPTWEPVSLSLTDGEVTRYVCTLCGKQALTVWFLKEVQAMSSEQGAGVTLSSMTLTKLGQLPSPETRPDPRVADALSEEGREWYRKALRSLAHGFGLGALAYFRRVVEDSTKEVLELVREIAEAERDTEACDRIDEAMRAKNMDEKLRLAADSLPASLRPGDVNPLRVLFAQYSKGLHDRPENERSEIAARMKSALEYMLRTWKAQIDDARTFGAEVRRWADPTVEPHES